MNELYAKRCLACEGGVKPLGQAEITKLLLHTPAWQVNETATTISRHFTFKNFYLVMAFVNAVAWIAHQENHHPDIQCGYNYCILKYNTHAIGGLSENDFICAAKVNRLIDNC